jgi:1,2-dihydroxy-3-keto-5-methylthiopentene dioxygenase
LRAKFLSEHTHSEDEVRFFVRGQGLFSMHIENNIYSIMCCGGDLISVPANTPHWFDMGEEPNFTCIRMFNNQAGWVAKYTGSDIANNYPNFHQF